MAQTLEFNKAVVNATAVIVPTFDEDMNIIQKLDDEPNDVGGLSAEQLKAEFDSAGNKTKDFINNELLPAIIAEELTEETRAAAEAERVANEQERVTNEDAREKAEAEREKTIAKVENLTVEATTLSPDAEATAQVTEDAETGGYKLSLGIPKGKDGQGSGDMLKSIYDPQGKEQDIFAYVDQHVPSAVGMPLDPLWTNPDPTAAFAAQTVALDLSTYDFIGYEADNGECHFIRIGATKKTNTFYSTHYLTWRNVYATSTGVVIEDAKVLNTLGSDGPTIDNTTAIPAKIYGLRNTSSSNSTGDGTTESITHPGCFYRMVNGVQEWLNPPMEMGVEYKTTERYLGKPVYRILFDFGALPVSTSVQKAHNISDVSAVTALDLIATNNSAILTNHANVTECIANSTHVIAVTSSDMSHLTVIAKMKYTKTTD